LIFILISAILTFLIAAGVCYFSGYNGKGAIFLVIGLVMMFGTYESYRSKRREKSLADNTNNTGWGFFDCIPPIGEDCTNVDCGNADCGSPDCGSLDCGGGDCSN